MGSSSASASTVRSCAALGLSTSLPTMALRAVAAKNVVCTIASRNPNGSRQRAMVTSQPTSQIVVALKLSSCVTTPWNTRMGTVSMSAGT